MNIHLKNPHGKYYLLLAIFFVKASAFASSGPLLPAAEMVSSQAEKVAYISSINQLNAYRRNEISFQALLQLKVYVIRQRSENSTNVGMKELQEKLIREIDAAIELRQHIASELFETAVPLVEKAQKETLTSQEHSTLQQIFETASSPGYPRQEGFMLLKSSYDRVVGVLGAQNLLEMSRSLVEKSKNEALSADEDARLMSALEYAVDPKCSLREQFVLLRDAFESNKRELVRRRRLNAFSNFANSEVQEDGQRGGVQKVTNLQKSSPQKSNAAAVTKKTNSRDYLELARKGDFETIERDISLIGDINARDKNGNCLLQFAAESGNLPLIKLLLSRGAQIDLRDKEGRSALYYSAQCGHAEVAGVLIKQGADLVGTSNDGWHPIHMAAGNNHRTIVELFVSNGVNVNCRGNNGWTPLHMAVENGHLELAQLLISRGADVNAADSASWTILHTAAFNGNADMVQLLLSRDANTYATNASGNTALSIARAKGHKRVIKLLLAVKSDVKASAKPVSLDFAEFSSPENVTRLHDEDYTPLHIAVLSGNRELVALCLRQSEFSRKPTKKGITALHMAVERGDIEIVELLLKENFDINALTCDHWTPLHYACGMGHAELVALLLARGANVRARDNEGWTPLYFSVINGNTQVVRNLILWGGANLLQDLDNEGCTSLFVAASIGRKEIVELLLSFDEALANLCETTGGWSPLHIASKNGHTEVVKTLISHKARLDAMSKLNWCPLHMALAHNHREVMEILVAEGANVQLALETAPTESIKKILREALMQARKKGGI